MRQCDVCFAFPGTEKQGEARICASCHRRYRVVFRRGLMEVLPK